MILLRDYLIGSMERYDKLTNKLISVDMLNETLK